jgi:hypothetical protein
MSRITIEQALEIAVPHHQPGRLAEAQDILITGCDTERQSLLCADHFANARILAIDLSLASLA